MEQISCISLFSGALGLDLGLEQAGINIRLALDNNSSVCQTIRLNRPDLPVLQKDVSDVSGDELLKRAGLASDQADLIAGGPPCQSFSVFGKRRGTADERGLATIDYLRIISEIRPKAFVMENVRGLLSMRTTPDDEKGSLFASIQAEFGKLGYNSDCFVVNSVNYGAPQIRERIIVIGNRLSRNASFPKPTHSNRPKDKLQEFATLGDALRGFVDPDPSLMDFSERKKKYLSMVPPGGNWRSLPPEIQKESMGKTFYLKGGRSAYWRKLSFDFPCPTIVTMPNHAGTCMCHPTELRTLTVGECARIQGFPSNWIFHGTTTEKYAQIGNAVPVILGKMAGLALVDLLNNQKEQIVLNDTSHRIVHLRPHVRTRWWWKKGRALGPISYYGDTSLECTNSTKRQSNLQKWQAEDA